MLKSRLYNNSFFLLLLLVLLIQLLFKDLTLRLTMLVKYLPLPHTYMQQYYINLLCVKILSFPFFPCFKRKRREAAGVKLSRNCVSFFIVSTWVSPNENMSSQMDVNCFQAEIICLLQYLMVIFFPQWRPMSSELKGLVDRLGYII